MNHKKFIILVLSLASFLCAADDGQSDCLRLVSEELYNEALSACISEQHRGNPELSEVIGRIYMAKGREYYKDAYNWYMQAFERCQPWWVSREVFQILESYGSLPEFFLKEAEKLRPEALFVLGDFYRRGLFKPKNEKKAFELYLLAAKGGNCQAKMYVSLAYAEGMGVEKDKESEQEWERKAAYAGYGTAQENYAFRLYYDAYRSNDREAIDMLIEASLNHMDFSQFLLGESYHKGNLVGVDLEKAYYWISRAARNGNEDAKEYLALHPELAKSPQ